jgi:hypothetical protein
MSVDVEKVTNGFQTLQELWSTMVTIIVACTLLSYKVGYVMFAPLLCIVTLISSTSMCSLPSSSTFFLFLFADHVSGRFYQPLCRRRPKGMAQGRRCADQTPRAALSFIRCNERRDTDRDFM